MRHDEGGDGHNYNEFTYFRLFMIDSMPLLLATSIQVCPLSFLIVASAPCSKSTLTDSSWPCSAAMWRGVLPARSCMSGSAGGSKVNRYSMQVTSPDLARWWRHVSPPASAASMLGIEPAESMEWMVGRSSASRNKVRSSTGRIHPPRDEEREAELIENYISLL